MLTRTFFIIFIIFFYKNVLFGQSFKAVVINEKIAKISAQLDSMHHEKVIELATPLFAQVEKNSQHEAILQRLMGEAYCKLWELKSAKKHVDNSLAILDVRGDTSSLEAGLNQLLLGNIYRLEGSFDTAFFYIKKAENIILQYPKDDWATIKLQVALGGYEYNTGNYKKGLTYFEKMLPFIENGEQQDALKAIRVHGYLAYAYQEWDLKKAEQHYQQKAKHYEELFGFDRQQTAQTYMNLARLHIYQSEWNEAEACYLKSIEHLESPKDAYDLGIIHSNLAIVKEKQGDLSGQLKVLSTAESFYLKTDVPRETFSDLYHNIGHAHALLSNYKQAIIYTKKGLDISQEVFGSNHPELSSQYIALAILYTELGLVEEALALEKQAIRCVQNCKSIHCQSQLANAWNSIGSFYFDYQGDNEQALDYFQKSKNIYDAVYGLNHEKSFFAVSNIGNTYFKKRAFTKALAYFQEALVIAQQNTFFNRQIALALNNIANTYAALENYPLALDYFNQQETMLQQLYQHEVHKDKAELYVNMAQTYQKMKQFDSAIFYFKKAQNIYNQLFKNINPNKVENQLLLAKAHLEHENLQQFHHTLKAVKQDLNIDINVPKQHQKNIYFDTYLDYFQTKRTYYKGEIYGDEAPLHADSLLQNAHHALQLFDTLQQNSLANSKLFWMTELFPFYEDLIQIYQQKQEFAAAFEQVERSKTRILKENLQAVQATSFANIPDSLLQQQLELKIALADKDKKLYVQQYENNTPNDSLIRQYQNKQFELKQAQNQLLRRFEKEFPKYYQAKYDKSVISSQEAQNLLAEDQALLEYFVGDTSIFIFKITKSSAEIQEIKKDFPLQEWVTQLRKSIYQTGQFQKDSSINHAEQYARVAHDLYQKLIEPVADNLGKRLLIIPDGVLHYLPFDALLMTPPDVIGHYRDYDYLIKNHAISTNFSMTLQQTMMQRKHPNQRKKLLSIAPIFSNHLSPTSTNKTTTHNTLSPLKYNQSETESIQALFDDKSSTDTTSLRSTFADIAGNYQIIHLATHAKANDKLGDYSYLAFTPQDSTNQHLLYVRDLYELPLQADMVVLSACETGLGELRRGEGIIGLTRALVYAGTKSTVTTFWNVNDKSSQEFMSIFYQSLNMGEPKDVALQAAKLEFIQQSTFPEPFFWSAYSALGDMSPLEDSRFSWWYYGLGLGLFLLLMISLLKWLTPRLLINRIEK